MTKINLVTDELMTRSTAKNDVKTLQRLLSSNNKADLINVVERRANYIEIQQERQKRDTKMIKEARTRMMKINAAN